MTPKGYDDRVGVNRAHSTTQDPQSDPAPMVQELVARLDFMQKQVPIQNQRILDYGCGTGLALQWLDLHAQPAYLLGLDISAGAIDYARQAYPQINFRVMDIEQADFLPEQKFDLVMCFEVLEHLQNPQQALLEVVQKYLKPSGKLVVSTPNRLVFSGGYEPSPINHTHIHEMDLPEFENMLARFFHGVHMWGMIFTDDRQMQDYRESVQHAISGFRLFKDLWWNPWISRFYRIVLRGEIFKRLSKGNTKNYWMASDFGFVSEPEDIKDRAIWFYAVLSDPYPIKQS